MPTPEAMGRKDFEMKYADINKKYTAIIAEHLAKGYTINTRSMCGSQGDYAHIDLTDALFCWTLLGLMWYPATHAARWLLDEIEMPGTWYVFWILPVVFLSLNIVMRPQEYSTLYTNRVMMFYPVLMLALLALLLFCYALFYWMARVQPERRRRNMRNFEKITAISNNPTWWLTLATEGGRGGTASEQLKMIE